MSRRLLIGLAVCNVVLVVCLISQTAMVMRSHGNVEKWRQTAKNFEIAASEFQRINARKRSHREVMHHHSERADWLPQVGRIGVFDR